MFLYELNQKVKLILSGEKGSVIGRVEYVSTNPQYLIEYVAADGRQVEGWFFAESILNNPLDVEKVFSPD